MLLCDFRFTHSTVFQRSVQRLSIHKAFFKRGDIQIPILFANDSAIDSFRIIWQIEKKISPLHSNIEKNMRFIKIIYLLVGLGFSSVLLSQERTEHRLSVKAGKEQPADTVKEFYENGALKSIYFPHKQTYRYEGNKYYYCLSIAYDEQGNRTRFTDDKIGLDRKYGSDGVLLTELIYNRKKSKAIQYIEYYPGYRKKSIARNGNKYEYDEDERVRGHWVRKSVRYNKKYGAKIATYYFEMYDVAGKIDKQGRCYSNMNEYDHWLHIAPEFPHAFDSIPLQDFKEIVYPQQNRKDVFTWDYSTNKTIVTRFEKKGDRWDEIQRRYFPRHPKNGLSYYSIK